MMEAVMINFTILMFKNLIIRRRNNKKNHHKVDLSQAVGSPLLHCLRELLSKNPKDKRVKKLIFIANITPNVIDIQQTENTLN